MDHLPVAVVGVLDGLVIGGIVTRHWRLHDEARFGTSKCVDRVAISTHLGLDSETIVVG